MLASSSGLKLQEYLENPFDAISLFPGLDLTICAQNGKTIDWQREKIDKKEWLADCSPFSLVILNLALNDLLS